MSTPLRFCAAVSAIALASMTASCAAPQQKIGLGGKADENVGLATRALIALNANQVLAAIDLAERAVEHSPNDATFRAVLGNAYFAAGRFSSAETAFKDSLTLSSNQPHVILKLALVETALGKKDQAVDLGLMSCDDLAPVAELRRLSLHPRSHDRRASAQGIHEGFPRPSLSIRRYRKGLHRLCTRPNLLRRRYQSGEPVGCVFQ